MLISFENVSFAYRDVPILQDVSFALHENESVGFIGGNGEGKTTLLRLLLNELTPDEGNLTNSRPMRVISSARTILRSAIFLRTAGWNRKAPSFLP